MSSAEFNELVLDDVECISDRVIYEEMCKAFNLGKNRSREIRANESVQNANDSVFSKSEALVDCCIDASFFEADAEYQAAQEVLCAISIMYDSLEEQENSMQEANNAHLKEKMDASAEILSPCILNGKLKNINTVIAHIRRISMKVDKLKQMLRDNALNDYMKIHLQYHRYVINFFNLACKILKDVESQIKVIEMGSHYADSISNNVQSVKGAVSKLTAELHNSMDTLTEFRNSFSATDDMKNSNID